MKKESKNDWKKIGSWFAFIGGVILAFFLGRGTNSGTVRHDSDSLGKLQEGIKDSERSADIIGSGLNDLERNNTAIKERNSDIKKHNNNATDDIELAQQILRDAKNGKVSE